MGQRRHRPAQTQTSKPTPIPTSPVPVLASRRDESRRPPARSYVLPGSGTISVLMAVGPVHRWLAEAVQSVLAQELPEGWALELLIGVDGVPESLAAARFCAADPRVGIVSLASPGGPYVASNTMLRHASGDLVGRVDADDVLLPGRMAAIIAALRDDPTAGGGNTWLANCSADLRERKVGNYAPDGVWVWRREALDALGGWQAWPCGADTDLLDRARALGLGEAVVCEPLYLRRRHDEALTRASATGAKSPARQAAWAAVRAGRGLYRSGAMPSRITPHASQHSVEGPLFSPRPVWAGLASIPVRREALAEVVAALLPQVDRLGVYLDCYSDVPGYLDDPRVSVARSQDRPGLGDAGKMIWASQAPGYYLSCDDDLIYPPDYAEAMVAAIRSAGHSAVVGVHGARIAPGATVYHSPDREVLHYREALATPQAVHIVGTGTAGWHAPTIRIRLSDFGAPNMADLWLAARAQRERIPLLVVARPAGWLGDLACSGPTICGSCARVVRGGIMDTRDRQDAMVRALAPWRLHEVGR